MRPPKPKPGLGALALLGAGLWLLLGGGERGAQEAAERLPVAKARIVEVIDGDTARALVAGREQSVRYIGVDTPESAIPGHEPECFGKKAARINRRLVLGERVRLRFGRERRDPYGRLLAYVRAGETFVNAELVRRGYARTLAIAPNDEHAPMFARLQQRAANSARGLWAAC